MIPEIIFWVVPTSSHKIGFKRYIQYQGFFYNFYAKFLVLFSKNHGIFPFFSDELGYLVDAIVNEDKIDSFDSRPNNMSIEDKHLLSRLLLLLNPNYSNLAGGGGGGGGRNRRPSRRKKPIINVIEGN